MSQSADAIILGAGGMLGSHVARVAPEWATSTARLRLEADVQRELDARAARVVVNCIGYRGQDDSEHHLTNALLPHWIADWCEENDAMLVHVSTNAVFAPDDSRRWLPTDPVAPRTPYEVAKARGEDSRAVVVRTTFVGHERGILASLSRGEPIPERRWNGVTALALAECIVERARTNTRPGIVHVHSPEPMTMRELAALMGSRSTIGEARGDARLLGGGAPMPPFSEQWRRYQTWTVAP